MANDVIRKDLGEATAYAYAVSKGYTGTEEEFAELMASYATVAEDAAQSAQEAADEALVSEGHASGTQDEVPVSADSPYYHNNAAYFADQADQSAQAASGSAEDASGSAGDAATQALKSEGYAVGKQNGSSVSSDSPYYHNNASYWNTQAQGEASAAAGSATSAEGYSKDSQAWSEGVKGSTPVTSDDPQYQNNAKYWATQSAASAATSAAMTGLAPQFSTSTSYAAGDQVLYNGVYYEFTVVHAAGAWTGTDVKTVLVSEEVSDLKSHLSDYIVEERKTNGIRQITDFTHGAPVNGYVFPLKLSEVTSRVRTNGFIYVNEGDRLVVTPGSYKFAVWQWDGTPESGSVVINRLWSTSTLTLTINAITKFVMVVFADATDATADVDLSEFDGTITVTPYEQLQIDSLETMLNATRLSTNTDLNTVLTPGYYSLMSNYTFSNFPAEAVGSACLLFETNDSTIKFQTLFALNSKQIFTRYKGASWTAWSAYIPPVNGKAISMLFVGNSLTQDGIAYLPYLLKNYYPEIRFKLYMWYNGGYTLAQQYADFTSNEPCDVFSVAEDTEAWTNYSNSKTMESVLSTYKFDVVSIQEYFNYKETYTEADLTDLNNCKDYITAHYTGGNGLEFITLFHAPLRSDADNVFTLTKNGIILTLQKTICDDMIPNGIAVYRALSTDLDNLGDQGHLSPDGTHTQEGLPCLLQTFVTACWLFDRLGLSRSVYGCPIRMTTAIYNTLNVPGANLGTGVITGTDAQNLLAQEVAIKAYKEGKYYVENNIFAP